MNKRIPLGIVIALLCLCVAGSAVLTGIYVCSILVSDILLMLLDPRIRTVGKEAA